jgi:uncharacterized repeat protein (TIGR03803 family)
MNYKRFSGAASAALMIVIILALVLAPSALAASKYKTLHKFTGENTPWAGMVFDQAGNLYGTTIWGGNSSYCDLWEGCGTVCKLTPNADGGWTESTVYSFCALTSCTDGRYLSAALVFDQAGNLYGTTRGGGAFDSGTVFKLTPNSDGSWSESVLYNFCTLTNCSDGDGPFGGPLIFDQAGNLYGTTAYGGNGLSFCLGCGVAFRLTPNADGSWSESVLYAFTGGTDGGGSNAGVIFDRAGNLYGTTTGGGAFGAGTAFKLVPNAARSWSESVVYSFTGGKDGGSPQAGLIFDQAGNLYSTTLSGGRHFACGDGNGCGVVFKLTPSADGSWTESVLHTFTGGKDGRLPQAGLTFDPAGNLYGTTSYGGDLSYCGMGCGVVFKLGPTSTGGWKETVLHTFLGHPGAIPYAGLIFDAAGDIYGTTTTGGRGIAGSVFEITP